MNTLTGGSWYVLNTAANALPVNGRWLVAQVTTTGAISGQINYQVFPLGVGADQVQVSMPFDGTGTFGGGSDIVCGCIDDTACNYNADATNDDGSCTYQTDPLLNCDGTCINDADGDGVCDENEVLGCTVEAACNYNPAATDNDGSCAQTTSAACAAEAALPMAHVTATATSSTSVVFAVAQVWTLMPMAFATTSTIVWARLTHVACATVLVLFTTAVAPTSLQVTATAMATSSTPVVFAVVTAHLVLALVSQSVLALASPVVPLRLGHLC